MAYKQQPIWHTIVIAALVVTVAWLLSQTVESKPSMTDEESQTVMQDTSGTESLKAEVTTDTTPIHAHEFINLTDPATAPTVQLNAVEDSIGGWNIELVTTNFTFTPELVNTDAIIGEGHAHLYVDGTKVARVYTNWFHLAELTPGNHTIRVELNANDHAPYVLNGAPIESIIQVEQSVSAESIDHTH